MPCNDIDLQAGINRHIVTVILATRMQGRGFPVRLPLGNDALSALTKENKVTDLILISLHDKMRKAKAS